MIAAVTAIATWAAARELDFRHDETSGHGAVFSRCGRYRYLLWRDAVDGVNRREMLAIAMLNPSKADHLANDPTIARCHRWATGAGDALLVWNLFALRETDPSRLKRRRGPVGRHNDDAIRLALNLAPTTVAAWGVHGTHRGRDVEVATLCGSHELRCYGVTKYGHPRHPLYLKNETIPQVWPIRP
ncbi:DUF1643 domain-containing protein [Croceicoccus ponticola]|uniref:DUF1643 domain-containing protein n=1 Tax=Croceicoccus ponticola TaxID=2217664 RepID=A0A437GUV6_9SPHN|nr:DUF1643 domain-containing protein [Croceicoccus ponticola]RVQ65455.1 DUF1643 domain-containing protein [Croceicoccus ponticola]